MLAMAASVVLEALRGRLGWLMGLVLLAGVAISEFVAAISITESRDIAVMVLAAWLRLAMVFVVALFVVSSMLRDWNDKGMELVLALPISRSVYLLGRLLGYVICAAVGSAVCAALLTVHVPPVNAFAWGVSFACELLIVAAMGTLCVLTLSQVPLAMTALMGFYLLSRCMVAIELMARTPVVGGSGLIHQFITAAVTFIDWLLPDLHALARSEWLVGSAPTSVQLLSALASALVYLALILAVALFDMQRKVL